MPNQNDRRGRRSGPREPEVTRHVHPIRTMPPCAGEMSWMRGTLACHSQMLAEILELLRRQDPSCVSHEKPGS